MTLAVPASSQATLLRPLTESSDFYDSPDTPGTSYSFQDQPASRSNMQADPAHLHAPILDTAMLMSTDDEMLDSDSDHRRDEDYDIELDAEVYSVTGDLEINMAMEDDSFAYGHEVDNDDIMLDDEPLEEYHTHMFSPTHNPQNTLPDTPVEVMVEAPIHEQASDQHIDLPQAAPLHQDPSEMHATQQQRQESDLLSEPALVIADTAASDNVASALAAQPEQTTDREHQLVDVELQQERPSTPHDDAPTQSNPALEHEDNDGTQSSTATLSHGNEGHSPAEDNAQATGHGYTNSDSAQGVESYDSSYQYPIVVQYEQNRLTLFPPMAGWSENPLLSDFYASVPSDYLLPDVGVCEKPLEVLFMHLRDVLGPAVDLGSELVVEIELLGIKFEEARFNRHHAANNSNFGFQDNTACKSVTLRRILDMHNQLYENDGYEVPLPVTMLLYTVPRFYSRLEEISAAVQERKGLQECLNLLKLSHDYEEDDSIDTTEENEATSTEEPKVTVDNAPNEDHESKQAIPEQVLNQDPADALLAIQEDGPEETRGTDESAPAGDAAEAAAPSLERESHSTSASENSAAERSGHVSPSVEDEELLEYEEDGDDSVQAQAAETEHVEPSANASTHSTESDDADELLDEDEGMLLHWDVEDTTSDFASTENQQSLQNDDAHIQASGGELVQEHEQEPLQEQGHEHDHELGHEHELEIEQDHEPKPDHEHEPEPDHEHEPEPEHEHEPEPEHDHEHEHGHDLDHGHELEHEHEQNGADQVEAQTTDVAYSKQDESASHHDDDTESNKPSPIPVFGGDDDEEEGEYDNQQHGFEGYTYGQTELPAFQAEVVQETDNDHQTADQVLEGNHTDVESYTGEPHHGDEFGEHLEGDDFDEYYDDDNQGDYIEQQETEFIQREVGEDELEEYDFEEYDDSHFENPELETPEEIVIVNDPTVTDAIDVVTHSPALSTQEEELIDYEDNDNEESLQQSELSSTSHKRLREDQDEHEGDDELDEENQGWCWTSRKEWSLDGNMIPPAAKRARAEW